MNTKPASSAKQNTKIDVPAKIGLDDQLKSILSDVLGIELAETREFRPYTGLFGHLPELDSMAVAGLLTEIEDRLDIVIEDDEVDGEILETYGALLGFVEAKKLER